MTLITDNDITKNELLQSLTSELAIDTRRAGDVTIYDLMVSTGRGYDVCKDLLAREVRAGRLRRRWILENGRRVYAYYRE